VKNKRTASFDQFEEWAGLAYVFPRVIPLISDSPRFPVWGYRQNSLQANDEADPYLASYYPPETNFIIGLVVHFRWDDFIYPDFTQELLQASL